MDNRKKFIIRLIIHLLGATFIAFGVQSIIYSSLGAAPLDALNTYLAKIHVQLFGSSSEIQVVIGIYSFVVGTLVTLILFIIQREKRLIWTWLNIVLVSIIISLWGLVYKTPLASGAVTMQKILFGSIGVFSISFGVFLTISTGLPPGPHEELLNFYNKKINNLLISKLIVEITYLLLAVLAMVIYVLLTTGISNFEDLDFSQIGYFTIIAVVGVSLLIYLFNFIYKIIKDKFFQGRNEENEDERKSIY